MDNGRVAEEGTYNELVQAGGAFSQLIKQFGSQDDAEVEEETKEEEVEAIEATKKRRAAVQGAQHMQAEERNKGSVSGKSKSNSCVFFCCF